MSDTNETIDRGDDWTPNSVQNQNQEQESRKEEVAEHEVEEKASEQPRDADGKFAKRERERDDEVRIPKSRFDEQVARERERAEAAERRLAELERQLGEKKEAAPDPVTTRIQTLEEEIDALTEKRDEAALEGKLDEVKRLSKEIRLKDREVIRLETEQVASKTSDSRIGVMTEEQRIDKVVTELQSSYSMLKEGSDDYNQDVVELILDKQTVLISRGHTPSEALAKAGADVMKLLGTQKASEETPTEEGKPNPGEQRKLDARAKAIDAMKRQPGSLNDVGSDSDAGGAKKVDLEPSKLSPKEFAALTEEQLARMRGDFIE